MKSSKWVLLTAFLEGLSVLVIEIVGARAIAPFYGTSLRVWTAQITATLLFLALGYGLGGRWSRTKPVWALPAVFWAAGAWLVLFPFWRVSILKAASLISGVGTGSFVAGALLFGVPLLALGAVSPLLIQRLEGPETGSGGAAAGRIFFTNTLGGLAGGWLAALVLIPHFPLRLILASTGLVLALIGCAWAWSAARLRPTAVGVASILLICLLIAPRPAQTLMLAGRPASILYRHASSIGLIQVLDMDGEAESLLIDGITQGGMARNSGTTIYEFTEYQAYLSWRYHPRAQSALLLGLGTGLLAKQLDARGVRVDAAEVEPRIEEVARQFFGMPAAVTVHLDDARAYLGRPGPSYDLIFLDAFAGENVPWYLVTREGLEAIRARLNPGGRLVINSVTGKGDGSPGLARLEAGLMKVFDEVQVFVDGHNADAPLVNACLVAGRGLKMNDGKAYPGLALEFIAKHSVALAAHGGRPAREGGKMTTDDFSDLDHAEAPLRLSWRRLVLDQLGPEVLGD